MFRITKLSKMNVHQRRDEWNMVPGYGISPRTRVKQNEFHSIE